MDELLFNQRRERLRNRADHRQRAAQVLNEKRHAHRRNKRRELRLLANRLEGQNITEHSDQSGSDHRTKQTQDQVLSVEQIDVKCGIRAEHQIISVSGVNQAHDAIDHRIAQRHQRIHAAELETIDKKLYDILHAFTSFFRCKQRPEAGSSASGPPVVSVDQPLISP